MPAEGFVGIWKFIARPNLCGTPRLREAATPLAAISGDSLANSALDNTRKIFGLLTCREFFLIIFANVK